MTPHDRHVRRLAGVHPMLVLKVARIFEAMRALGYEMTVTDGVRSVEAQQRLYDQGRTRPGRIVTDADGIHVRSNHQAREDGYGHAVDCAFVIDGQPAWADSLPWELYGAMARALGLRWGIRVQGWIDRPHIELP